MTKQSRQHIVDEIASGCIGARIRLLGRAISGIYDDVLRSNGVRFSQMNILVATARIGVTRQADLCSLLHMDHSTVSRNVDRMIAKGWIENVSDEDGRAAPFRITEQGHRLIGRAYPAWKQAQERISDLLGADSVAALHTAVRRLHGAESGGPSS